MKSTCRASLSSCLLAISFVATASIAWGQAPLGDRHRLDAAPSSLIQRMAGDWDVKERMWPGPGTEAIDLPSARAHRRLIGGTILEEQMELSPGAKGAPFTRIAYFNYNSVNRQYEYFSIDTRAPQMMNERSYNSPEYEANDPGPITLWGGMFVAPKWGNEENAAFSYRIVIGPIFENSQIVRLYLTPLTGVPGVEFLAFEYVYARRT